MLIDAGMDTGKLLTYRTHHIAPDAATPSLTEGLITLSDQLLQDICPLTPPGSLNPKTNHTRTATLPANSPKADSIGHLQVGHRLTPNPRLWMATQPHPPCQTDVVVTAAHVAAPR